MDANAQPFVCTDCKRRAPAAGECSCGAGPMLDLRQQNVIDLLIEEDDRRRERQYQRFLWAGVIAGVASIFFALQFLSEIILAIPLPIPFGNPVKFIALGIGVAVLVSKVLHWTFKVPYRFPELRR